jgi:multisubunit Na+/H+ antiporter MnhB subunit
MLNLDFNTLVIISVPGFVLGLMTGRFLASARWRAIKSKLGRLGELLSGLALLVLFGVTLIVLGVMVIYLWNFPETSKPVFFWYPILFGVWMAISVILELIDLSKKRT